MCLSIHGSSLAQPLGKGNPGKFAISKHSAKTVQTWHLLNKRREIHFGLWQILLMEEFLHQLIGYPGYPVIYKVLYIPGGAGFLLPTVLLEGRLSTAKSAARFPTFVPLPNAAWKFRALHGPPPTSPVEKKWGCNQQPHCSRSSSSSSSSSSSRRFKMFWPSLTSAQTKATAGLWLRTSHEVLCLDSLYI